MKISEIIELSVEELTAKLVESENDLNDLKFKHSLKQLENPLTIRNLRRDIARIKTVLTKKGQRV
jgi:large subunit ribosomal protein L29